MRRGQSLGERWREFVHGPTKSAPRVAAWALLGGLLGLIFLTACLYERAGWPGPMPGEATTLMQAESLGRDFDLRYERQDFDRLSGRWGSEPADLELASAGGKRITFDRPFPYALWLAPFVRLWPGSGFAIANALLLIIASLACAFVLQGRVGGLAPFWIALLVFASVTFDYVFLATGDLFQMVLAVIAFCLLAEDCSPRLAAKVTLRWAFGGVLLAVLVASAPLLVVLPLAAFFSPPRGEESRARHGLLVGFASGLVVLMAVDWWAGGGLLWFGAERFRFTPETGFPLVDFPAAAWPESLRQLTALHWDGAPRFSWGFEPWLWMWNGLYLWLGRNIGILTYFLPVTLLVLASGGGRRTRALWLAALAFLLGLLIFRPFNLAAGEGSLGNRLFLPIYGALWLTLSRRRSWLWGVGCCLLTAPFLSTLWLSPWAYPIESGGGYSYLSPAAERCLPFETSQRRIPSGEEVRLDTLWVRFLNESGWAETGRGRLIVDRGGEAALLIASPEPLDVLRLDFGPDAPGNVEVWGGKLGEKVLLPSGGIAFRILPRRWQPRHAMWWSPRRQYLYRLGLSWPDGEAAHLPFTLTGERVPEGK